MILREMQETVFEMLCIEGETYFFECRKIQVLNKKSYLSNRHS